MRSKLTVRGSESFCQGPVAKAVKFKRPESMVDIQRRSLMQMREEEAARIKTEEDFKRDFLDFSYVTGVDDYGLPLQTPYYVPDDVPDVYIPEKPAPQTQPEESALQGSLSKEDSASESSGGSE